MLDNNLSMGISVKKALFFAAQKLSTRGMAEYELEVEILLAAVLGKGRSHLLANQEEELSLLKYFQFKRLIEKRAKGYSSAVILGHKWFYGLDFLVNKNVLIPRPETELMVDNALLELKNNTDIKNIVDLGAGSGCIIISLAANIQGDDISYWGVDISRSALNIAKKNAKKLVPNSRINFLYSDLLNIIDKSVFDNHILITANLPYLTPKQVKNSPTIKKEPKIALLAGNDGLDCYRKLFVQIKKLLKCQITLMMEIDNVQKLEMEQLLRSVFPQADIEFKKDLLNIDRLVIVKIKEST
jgi:release factor glutamine methyltransferase